MNLNECTRYAVSVIDQLPNLSLQKKRYWKKELDRIRQKTANPFLYVALIGDFSTGKSTFINALVKKDILKTAWQATTAVPTYLFYHDGDEEQILVETLDKKRYRLDDEKQRSEFEKRWNIRLPSEAKDRVAFLSANNALAGRLRRIAIRVSGFEGLRHICLIDTPGVNPGAKEAAFHAKRTQEVLREEADAAIILFQETQIFSGSFQRFLLENAGRFMDDAVFVITMMDLAAQEERENLMEYVRAQLRRTFGLEEPPVFGCCARAVLSGKDDSESRYWTASFDRMRKQLLWYLSENRERILRKQLARLLEHLIGELDAAVTADLSAIEQRKKCLEEKTAADAAPYEERYREYLFTKEKMEIQIRRYTKAHETLREYLKIMEKKG